MPVRESSATQFDSIEDTIQAFSASSRFLKLQFLSTLETRMGIYFAAIFKEYKHQAFVPQVRCGY